MKLVYRTEQSEFDRQIKNKVTIQQLEEALYDEINGFTEDVKQFENGLEAVGRALLSS